MSRCAFGAVPSTDTTVPAGSWEKVESSVLASGIRTGSLVPGLVCALAAVPASAQTTAAAKTRHAGLQIALSCLMLFPFSRGSGKTVVPTKHIRRFAGSRRLDATASCTKGNRVMHLHHDR